MIKSVLVFPRPVCKECGRKMLLQRPFYNEKHYDEFWKCPLQDCGFTLPIDQEGNPDWEALDE